MKKRGLDLESKIYKIIVAPEVLEKIEGIEGYISTKYSATAAKKRVRDIFDSLYALRTFPEIGFDADDKVGFRIDERYFFRGVVMVDGKYIALYYIDEDKLEVNIAYLFSTREDYILALREDR